MLRICFVSGLILLALSCFACNESSDIVDQPNIYCQNEEPFVCEGDSLKICGTNGRWAYESCASICEQRGLNYTGECAFDSDMGHDMCACEDLSCEAGGQRCEGDSLLVCTEGSWNRIGCDDYCSRFSRESLGCGIDPTTAAPACLCEGASAGICGAGYKKCGENPADVCGPLGSWSSVSCAERCADLGFYFGYCETDVDTPEEVCHCNNQAPGADCVNHSPTCIGDDIEACEGGELATTSCETICAELGLTYASCDYDADREHDVCRCVAAEAE